MMGIKHGESILLAGKRNYLIDCSGKFSCKYGSYDLDKLKGKKFGTRIKIGEDDFLVLKPTIVDFLFKRAVRGPQVITPKDAAAIAARTGCGTGWKVADAGSGSGFLAIFLANLGCEVSTFERRDEFYKKAKWNIDKSGLNIKIFNKDVNKGIPLREMDLVTLDLEHPEKILKHAHKALKLGGWVAVYSMHIEQVIAARKELGKLGFSEPITEEVLQRGWQSFRGGFTRPKTHMLAHTGFLTLARKL